MNQLKSFLVFLLSLFMCHPAEATIHSTKTDSSVFCNTFLHADTLSMCLDTDNDEVLTPMIADSTRIAKNKGKKTIAAILAFPLPFGILGLHRIFLSTKPYMPFVYVGTIGGCFGILPLIDFIAILSANEEKLQRFENNAKVFMWSH